ncbi:MAG: NUDIX hydrolase [Propionibacteriaceae bacterium]
MGEDQQNKKHPDRAAGIVIEAGKVLLIERQKPGERYWVTPGGKVEPGETAAQACAREMLEEVNLVVEVGDLLNTFADEGRTQWFFSIAHTSGEVRLGDGPEALRNSEENRYLPVWIEIAELDSYELRPREAKDIIASLLPKDSSEKL